MNLFQDTKYWWRIQKPNDILVEREKIQKRYEFLIWLVERMLQRSLNYVQKALKSGMSLNFWDFSTIIWQKRN